ncbi:MAG: tRNA uridine(34) 5-carboxymethylaminomethyl modification radical SAM/GNAT enzyme Elp3 [bacterium]|nr:tRNA uridine(34) 5-carboxymethylaminomethyl modification radical SAM/GNAT enzyme Elp3 [bacterium]
MKQKYDFDVTAHTKTIIPILQALSASDEALSPDHLNSLLRKYPKPTGGVYSRSQLIAGYRELAGTHGLPPYDETFVERIRLKPVRTSSGVTPVTVLTKPFPCPGTCIFCPNDVRMPKSYLSDEPGAQRAEQNSFDPYLQTYSRLLSYHNTGHPTDKIELIILGGTWSFYPETYQIWFIKRIFDALHDFGDGVNRCDEVETLLKGSSKLHPENNITTAQVLGVDLNQSYNQVVQTIYSDEMARSRDIATQFGAGIKERTVIDEFATWDELEAAHKHNESAACRSVGLVIETRPDHISVEEVLRIRRLGCTKVQIGFQSLNDDVLRANKRGHMISATRRAVKLLRMAGFKIHAHWMPNLYKSTPDLDIEDYRRMFNDPDFRPDELKVYPCSLIESAELMQRYQDGSWKPYTHEELLHVLTTCFKETPEYCRLTRVIRDIPGTDIVVGNKATNFRQLVENALAKDGERSPDIRAREVRLTQIAMDDLSLDELWYDGSCTQEVFMQYITQTRDIAGFLRLSLPNKDEAPLTEELRDTAMIREVHVYGQALGIGESGQGRAQHLGLGTLLIERAVALAKERGFTRLAVISAIGTREYYRKRGFVGDGLYQVREI